MRSRVAPAILLAALAVSCGPRGGSEPARTAGPAGPPERVAVVSGLAGPESVRYDPELDVYYVSNFNGEPEGDANGFISRVSANGEVLAREFMVGTAQAPLHGPRGLWLSGDTLWAADQNGVHGFDRKSGAQIVFVSFTRFSPGFLNDIARGPDGALYVTDTGRSRIYRVTGERVTIALEDTALTGPNGITWDGSAGRFLTASWNPGPRLHAWKPGTRAVESAGAAGPGSFDGLERIGARLLIASQSDSSLHEITDGGERVLIKLPGEPADIGVDTRRGRIAVPMVGRDEVEIWALPAIPS